MNEIKSGTHIQCFGAMKKFNSMDPLGILCNLSNIGEWKPDPYIEGLFYYKVNESHDVLRPLYFPPSEVYDFFEISKKERDFLNSVIAVLNDQKYTFIEIEQKLSSARKVPKNG